MGPFKKSTVVSLLFFLSSLATSHAAMIAGQGTCGVEIAKQLSPVDAIFIAVGGGGLISGVGAFLKSVNPAISIVACQPTASPVMTEPVDKFEGARRGRLQLVILFLVFFLPVLGALWLNVGHVDWTRFGTTNYGQLLQPPAQTTVTGLSSTGGQPVDDGLLAWDGTWYDVIARNGYLDADDPALRFFPLYPLLGRWLGWIGDRPDIALVVVANVAALAAGVLLHRLTLEETGDAAAAQRSARLLALFPSAFVLVLAGLITWVVDTFLLKPFGLRYIQTLAFILVIAALVQFVELFLRKSIPALYKSLGIFLPLITTNCAVLGAAIINIQEGFNLLETLIFSLASAAGFGLALVLFAGIRERLEIARVPRPLQGTGIGLITAGLLALSFFAFKGMV